MPSIIALTDLVVNELNSQPWGFAFQAERTYKPINTQKKIKDLQVECRPSVRKRTILTRSSDDVELSVEIGIFNQYDDEAECDALVEFCDAIEGHFVRAKLDIYMCVEVATMPIYDENLIGDDSRLFASVISLKFQWDGT